MAIRTRNNRRRRARLELEALEDRWAPAVLTINTLADNIILSVDGDAGTGGTGGTPSVGGDAGSGGTGGTPSVDGDGGSGGTGGTPSVDGDGGSGVVPSNSSPVLDPIGFRQTTQYTPIEFTATAFDADGDRLTFSLADAGPFFPPFPTGATIDPSTGQFTWTPDGSVAIGPEGEAFFGVIVQVTDGLSAPVQESIVLRVTPGVDVDFAFRERGELSGAEYDIGVPQNWNGSLVVFAPGGGNDEVDHPSEAPFLEVNDDTTPLTDVLLAQLLGAGYAVASTGYSQQGWNVESGIADVANLLKYFETEVGGVNQTILAAHSYGSAIAEYYAEIPAAENPFDGVMVAAGFGTGAQNLADELLVTQLAYDVLFADDGGFRPEWGAIGDVRDAFDPAQGIFPVDFESDVLPVIAAQVADPANAGKWELLRLLNGAQEGPLLPPFFPGTPPIPFHIAFAMANATESLAGIERFAGGRVAQNLDHIYTLPEQDKDYLATLGVDADAVLATMNGRRVYTADEQARDRLGQFFTPTGHLQIPVLADHHANDPNIPIQARNYYGQRADVAGAGDWLLQVYVTPGQGHGGPLLDLPVLAGAMTNWLQTGEKPDAADAALFPPELGFDPNFEPLPFHFIPQPENLQVEQLGDDLVVVGTFADDVIHVSQQAGQVVVQANGVSFGAFNVSGKVQVFGEAGEDVITTSPDLTLPVEYHGNAGNDLLSGSQQDDALFGDHGNDVIFGNRGDDLIKGGRDNDVLFGGHGNDLLLGQAGIDALFGQAGRDVLIGGTGSDFLSGGSGEDVLIGGSTDFDNNEAALDALMREWTRTDENYRQRIDHILGTVAGGKNGTLPLNGTTVHDDGQEDKLTGGSGLDLHFASLSDKVHQKKGELVFWI